MQILRPLPGPTETETLEVQLQVCFVTQPRSLGVVVGSLEFENQGKDPC